MNTSEDSVDSYRESPRQRLWRFGYTLLTVFVGSLTTGILVVLGISASGCLWNPHVRCFSISQDTLGVIVSAAEIWCLPAVVLAFVIAAFLQVRSAIVWWSALIAVSVSVLAAGIFPFSWAAPARVAASDPGLFLAADLVMLIGLQLSRFISKLVGTFPI